MVASKGHAMQTEGGIGGAGASRSRGAGPRGDLGRDGGLVRDRLELLKVDETVIVLVELLDGTRDRLVRSRPPRQLEGLGAGGTV